jgi:hypothetical protein
MAGPGTGFNCESYPLMNRLEVHFCNCELFNPDENSLLGLQRHGGERM